MPKGVIKKKVGPKEKKRINKYTLDCTIAVKDKVFMANELLEFLKERIKVEGKTGNLGEKVKLTADDKRISVEAWESIFAKRYLKYLTKKFLRKQELRDYLHVIANKKDSYEVRYFKIENEEE